MPDTTETKQLIAALIDDVARFGDATVNQVVANPDEIAAAILADTEIIGDIVALGTDRLTLDRVAEELGCTRAQLDLWFARGVVTERDNARDRVAELERELQTAREMYTSARERGAALRAEAEREPDGYVVAASALTATSRIRICDRLSFATVEGARNGAAQVGDPAKVYELRAVES